jgi:hypothetical protein
MGAISGYAINCGVALGIASYHFSVGEEYLGIDAVVGYCLPSWRGMAPLLNLSLTDKTIPMNLNLAEAYTKYGDPDRWTAAMPAAFQNLLAPTGVQQTYDVGFFLGISDGEAGSPANTGNTSAAGILALSNAQQAQTILNNIGFKTAFPADSQTLDTAIYELQIQTTLDPYIQNVVTIARTNIAADIAGWSAIR